jgi:hypothetical protein
VDSIEEDISVLLADGPATLSQLVVAVGRPYADVERALVRLFSRMRVRPVGDAWHLLAAVSIGITSRGA